MSSCSGSSVSPAPKVLTAVMMVSLRTVKFLRNNFLTVYPYKSNN